MRKFVMLFALCLLLLSVPMPAEAADGRVTFYEDAGRFVFEPGSRYSPTDLFPNFKDVMPGDSLTQTITVRNDAENDVKVKIYMRALGAHADSVEFLSQLGLRVEKSADNPMPYMFDAAAHESAQLTDWVLLGTLYAGGEVDLDVTLSVPVTLDNLFQEKIGYLDWEFRIETFAISPEDPKPPYTGDSSHPGLWLAAMSVSLAVLLLLLFRRKRDRRQTGR